jgi:alpha-glucoside transport system permease protein
MMWRGSRGGQHPIGQVGLLLMCGLWAVPVIGLFVSSFRTPFDAAHTGWWRAISEPGSLTLGNYREVLGTNGLAEALVNSLVVTIPAVVMMMTVGSVAAYALARLAFTGRRAIGAAILVLAVVPVQVVLVPILQLYDRGHLAGTYTGIWLVHVGLSLPFGIYLLRGFFAALPDDLFQAAELDGADTLVAFVRIAVPLARPALASVAIFQFIWIWNDLLIALIFLGGDPDVAPLTVTIANLVNATTGEGTQLLAAAAFVAMAVPMVIFFALQRYFVGGILAGAVK